MKTRQTCLQGDPWSNPRPANEHLWLGWLMVGFPNSSGGGKEYYFWNTPWLLPPPRLLLSQFTVRSRFIRVCITFTVSAFPKACCRVYKIPHSCPVPNLLSLSPNFTFCTPKIDFDIALHQCLWELFYLSFNVGYYIFWNGRVHFSAYVTISSFI